MITKKDKIQPVLRVTYRITIHPTDYPNLDYKDHKEVEDVAWNIMETTHIKPTIDYKY